MARKFENEQLFTNETDFNSAAEEFTNLTQWFYEPIKNARVLFDEASGKMVVRSDKTHYLNDSGKYSLPARAGISGRVINDLSNDDWIKVLNTCFPYMCGNMILNQLEGEVYAAHSEMYSILPVDDIFSSARDIYKSLFPNAKFLWGTISPEFASAEYSLANELEVVKAYEEALRTTFANDDTIVAPTIRIVTSNTSDSGANIYPCLECKGKSGGLYTIAVGNPIKLPHRGGSTITKFRENLAGSMGMVQKSVENITRLTYIKIEHPQQCFLNIAKRLQLPKPICMEIGEEIHDLLGDDKSTHARFIYLALTRILDKVDKKTEKAQWDLTNQISRAFGLDFAQYDTKYCEWLKETNSSEQVSLFA